MKWKGEYTKTVQTIYDLGHKIKWEMEQIIARKKNKSSKKKRLKWKQTKKTASSPCQDLHPDWDRFRGTMLYPLSCGELAMNGEQILITLYVTSGERTRNKRTKNLCKTKCSHFKITFLQTVRCLTKQSMSKFSSVSMHNLNLVV